MPRHPQHLTNSVSARQRVPSAPLFMLFAVGARRPSRERRCFGRAALFVPLRAVTNNAPALIAYVRVIGLRAGDTQQLTYEARPDAFSPSVALSRWSATRHSLSPSSVGGGRQPSGRRGDTKASMRCGVMATLSSKRGSRWKCQAYDDERGRLHTFTRCR